jgi:Thiamine pyrophosphate-requiring enzymes [acetolactate synthase, pyruvate dehydrogenase (cytochrome), glyoxylate carboligase, phosphonopyruvate decarboxylase]
VITTDVGQNQLWTTQFLEITGEGRLLTSGGMGTMGYGLPAAIGAKLADPKREVLAICGDGGIQMNIQELATAVIYELPIIICVMNNGYLGNVRQWQELFYGRRYAGTCMRQQKSRAWTCGTETEYTPDFVRLAESYGARGYRVKRQEEVREVLLSGKEETRVPTLLEFIIWEEENVLPIVPPGKPLWDMITGMHERD